MRLLILILILFYCKNVFASLSMCVKKYRSGGRINTLYSGINNVCKNAKQYAISCNIFGDNCDYCDMSNGQDENEIREWCDKQGGYYEITYCYPLGCSWWCSPDYENCYNMKLSRDKKFYYQNIN